MPNRILVPLDGSEVAEAVLPIVAEIARGSGAAVRLLQVKPVPEGVVTKSGRVVAYADQEMARLEVQGLQYLEGARVDLEGIPVEPVVRFGDPVGEIAIEVAAWNADLVAMATSGRSRRWWTRRPVADALTIRTTAPVLVYRQGGRRGALRVSAVE
jgi:nucleotide-binding universal stress UspA family protein